MNGNLCLCYCTLCVGVFSLRKNLFQFKVIKLKGKMEKKVVQVERKEKLQKLW